MNKRHSNSLLRALHGATIVILFGIGVGACADLPGMGGTSWKEEALQHDGSRLVITRSVKHGGLHEIGQEPSYKEQSLQFSMPTTGQSVKWEDHYSQELGAANFLPMLVDVKDGVPYLVAYPMGCLSYNKWGRPNPPYVIFKYQGKEWNRIPLGELPAEIRTPNIIFSMPDVEVQKSGKSFISAEMVRQIIERYRQPEFKTVLREGISNAGGDRCGEMVGNGKGDWIGIGSFRDKPSLDACMSYCARHDFSAQYCPCNTLFKGK